MFGCFGLRVQRVVMETKSTKTMSFALSVMSCVVTLAWALYGLVLGDGFLIWPNAAGFVLACVQLSLFALYPSPSSTSSSSSSSGSPLAEDRDDV